VILDTNALTAFIDGQPAIGARLSAESRVAIPVIVLGEFRYGIAGSRHRAAYERWLDDHLPQFEILPITELTAVSYARVRMALKKIGRPIPANDAWIAALCLQHRLPVLTRDDDFDAVPGVRRERW
jgi:predicted nucleic acid-binding protein